MGEILWWHWILLGCVLVLLELVVPSFTIFWFGLGALLIGVLLLLFPELSVAAQIFWFAVTSLAFSVLWFRVLRPRMQKPTSEQSLRAAIGQSGIAATSVASPSDIGRVAFSIPVAGYESWDYQADEPIATGNRVRVIEIISRPQGNGKQSPAILKVVKIP